MEEAKQLLERAGYKVKAANKKATVITRINGKSHMGYIEADFVVAKKNKKYVVAVKSGELADASEPLTRRQLIEYSHVYKPDGILLLDLNRAELNKIEFSFPKDAREYFFQFLVILLIVFVTAGIIWLMIQLKLF
ncbi:MAG: hypothetical protein ABIJ26_06820 [Candidatus Margulisiibacteriota bacterium]|nr:hypothetical protein [Candidatus Margulisiibacteriota bacterium]